MTDPFVLATAFGFMLFGSVLIIAGTVLEVTVIGLPAGLGVDAIGVLMVIGGAALLGFNPMKGSDE